MKPFTDIKTNIILHQRALSPINGQELVKCEHLHLLHCNPKNNGLNIYVLFVTREQTFRLPRTDTCVPIMCDIYVPV